MLASFLDPANPSVFSYKTAYMQRISDRARSPNIRYISGQIKLAKLPSLAAKLAARYPLNLRKLTQIRHRAAGLNVYNFLCYYDHHSGLVYWILFCDKGEKSQQDLEENWQNPRSERIEMTGYELVRLTREGAKNPAWSWRYSTRHYESLRDAIISAIRGRRDLQLEQLIHTIWRSPGFAGIRAQIKKIGPLIKSEWSRSRSKSEVMPVVPMVKGYIARTESTMVKWSEIGKQEVKK